MGRRGRIENLIPATEGNTRAMQSGFWALAEIERNRRTAALAEWIREAMPLTSPADEIAIWLLAGCIERRIRGLAELAGSTKPERTKVLRRDLSTVENTISRLLDQLGMTPTARAKLGLDHVRGQALSEHLDRRYRE